MSKKFSKSEIRRYEFHYPLIIEELKEDRDISCILSGFGFAYKSEWLRMNEYLESVGKEPINLE